MANIEDLRGRSVSWGTLKSEDLIPKFLDVLKTYGKDKYDAYIKANPEVEDWKDLDDETMGWVVDELTDLLNEIAPDGCYFGASDSDGADFGFWSMSNESKKSEDASVHELEFVDIDEIYSASDFDDLVYKVVFSGQLDVDTDKVEQGVLPNDIIFTARGYNTATFDFEVDKIVKQLAGTGIVLKVDDVIKNEATYTKKSEAGGDYVKEAELAFQVTSDKIADYFYDGAYELDTEIKTMVYYDRKDIQYESTDNGVVAEVPMTFEAISSDIRKYARELASLASAAIDDAVGGVNNELAEYGQDLDSDYSFDDAETNGETWTWKVRFIWKHTTADESKKSEANGNKDIFTLDLTRIYADGDEVGLDDMQAAQNFYDEDEAIQAAKDLADSYKDDDDVVQVTVMAGEQEKPNGDIVGDSFDIFTASSSDSATTAKYREKAGYTKTDGLDYYAKGGTSEAKKSNGQVEIDGAAFVKKVRDYCKSKGYSPMDMENGLGFVAYRKGKKFYVEDFFDDTSDPHIRIYSDDDDGYNCYTLDDCIDVIESGYGSKSQSKKSESRKTKEELSVGEYSKYNMDHYAAKAAGWTWDDEQECYVDKDGYEVDWDSSDAVMIDPIEYGGHTYKQVNVWGDGTVEFQDETGESLNWADFDDELVSKVYAAIGGVVDESKKSESLTLKQKELKDMARFGQAEDITTISDEEAKALRKKGIETIGVSRGTYGMNGALLRDNEGKKYVITARSSNLFYFV